MFYPLLQSQCGISTGASLASPVLPHFPAVVLCRPARPGKGDLGPRTGTQVTFTSLSLSCFAGMLAGLRWSSGSGETSWLDGERCSSQTAAGCKGLSTSCNRYCWLQTFGLRSLPEPCLYSSRTWESNIQNMQLWLTGTLLPGKLSMLGCGQDQTGGQTWLEPGRRTGNTRAPTTYYRCIAETRNLPASNSLDHMLYASCF